MIKKIIIRIIIFALVLGLFGCVSYKTEEIITYEEVPLAADLIPYYEYFDKQLQKTNGSYTIYDVQKRYEGYFVWQPSIGSSDSFTFTASLHDIVGKNDVIFSNQTGKPIISSTMVMFGTDWDYVKEGLMQLASLYDVDHHEMEILYKQFLEETKDEQYEIIIERDDLKMQFNYVLSPNIVGSMLTIVIEKEV